MTEKLFTGTLNHNKNKNKTKTNFCSENKGAYQLHVYRVGDMRRSALSFLHMQKAGFLIWGLFVFLGCYFLPSGNNNLEAITDRRDVSIDSCRLLHFFL